MTFAGGLYAFGSVAGSPPFPLLIDTATVLSTRAAQADEATSFTRSALRLLDRNQVPRAMFAEVQLLATPLGSVGIEGAQRPIGGILGGDILQGYALELRYGADPSIALLPRELSCSCALADACLATLLFRLAGGGTFRLGNNIYTYPPTRVTLDACLQPVVDPWNRGLRCEDREPIPLGYTAEGAPGVDVRLLVATGFGGVLLGASAYDRLCDAQARYLGRRCPGGSAAALLATAPPIDIAFPSPGSSIRRAVRLQLGDPASDPPLAALALVGREGLLSPCAELGRSRRLRAHPPPEGSCDSGDRPAPGDCLQLLSTGGNDICGSPDRCNDRNQPAAAYIEFDEPIPFYLVEDTAPILLEVNNDVRPVLSDVEGVIGGDLLERLEMQIDYPNRRVIARCAAERRGCMTFPRYACPTGSTGVSDCGSDGRDLCNPPSAITAGGPVCLPAPIDRLRQASATAP